MKILAVSPVPDYATWDVYRGQVKGLKALGAEVIEMNYSKVWQAFADFREFMEVTGRAQPGTINNFLMAGDRIVMAALVNEVNLVYLVAPMHIPIVTLRVLEYLKRFGTKVAAYFTECPYDDEWVLSWAEHLDYAFVCDRSSVEVFKTACPGTAYVGHAYDPEVHKPNGRGRDIETLFAGTLFPSRTAFLEAVDWTGIDLYLTGLVPVKRDSPLRRFVRGKGAMKNAEVVRLYQRARIGLQLHRTDGMRPELIARALERGERGLIGAMPRHDLRPHSLGPRSYELAACGVMQIADDTRPELQDVFGGTVPTFQVPDEVGPLIRRFLDDEVRRQELAQQQQEAVQPYTFEARMRTVLETVS